MLCIGYAQSATDEGFASTKRDPSPGFAEFIIGRRFAPTRWRNHPLPQGASACTHLENRLKYRDLDDPRFWKCLHVGTAATIDKTRVFRRRRSLIKRCVHPLVRKQGRRLILTPSAPGRRLSSPHP